MTDLSLTLSSPDVTLTPGGGASVTASVTNTGAAADRVVCGVYAPTDGAPSAAEGTTVDRPLREVGPGATEQFLVTVGAGAPPGISAVRVITYSADRAPEEFADTAQTLTVHHEAVVATPTGEKRPWWLLLVAGLVLVVAVVGFVLVRSRPTATVAGPSPITTATAPACQAGFVPRLTRPSDTVCVSPISAVQVAKENTPEVQNMRKDPSGPYGPETCKPGWVWRDAYDGDTICVTGDTRSQAAQENIDAPLHAGP